jgi:DNA invertase Pin-like site-specific DNA recombinase
MKRIVKRVEFPEKTAPKMLRVATYARVSSGKDAMLHSLSAQVSYYNDLIQKHEGWLFCGVFADEATTGTKDSRENYQKLLEECRKGAIDLVLTKSISRFARNTVTLLETVRELKSLGVDVYFEEQNIHSISPDGELMLTVLASYAQEESRSASENRKWQIRKDFEQGKVGSITILGYRRTADGSLEVVPEEAEIVKMIFSDYLSGMGKQTICNKLNEMHIPTRYGNEWTAEAVRRILKNEKYCGDLLLQKTFRENYITKRKIENRGQLPKYYVEDAHEPIVDRETFLAVQKRMEEHQRFAPKSTAVSYPFTSMIKCGCCGKFYRRKIQPCRITWICHTYNTKGKKHCPDSKQIPEDRLYSACCEVLSTEEFDEDIFKDRICQIYVPEPNVLLFQFHDGHEQRIYWKDHSRSESWTDEMKERARERSKKK